MTHPDSDDPAATPISYDRFVRMPLGAKLQFLEQIRRDRNRQMAQAVRRNARAIAAGLRGGWSRLLLRITDRLAQWADRAAQRRRLMTMSDRALKDIGLTRGAAEREWQKRFWQP